MKKSAAVVKAPVKVPRKLGKLFRFFGDIIAELRKVVWPTRKELTNLTLMVIVVCVIIGAFLGALDFGFFHLFNKVLLTR